ncbi:hypothetical protein D3C81_2111370 [compost metagenome]
MSGGSLLPQKPNFGPHICRAEGRLVRREGSGDGVLPLLFEYVAYAAGGNRIMPTLLQKLDDYSDLN